MRFFPLCLCLSGWLSTSRINSLAYVFKNATTGISGKATFKGNHLGLTLEHPSLRFSYIFRYLKNSSLLAKLAVRNKVLFTFSEMVSAKKFGKGPLPRHMRQRARSRQGMQTRIRKLAPASLAMQEEKIGVTVDMSIWERKLRGCPPPSDPTSSSEIVLCHHRLTHLRAAYLRPTPPLDYLMATKDTRTYSSWAADI